MAKQIIKITKTYSVPFNFEGKKAMAHWIGNSMCHKYIIYEDNAVEFIRYSSTKDKFVKVAAGGPKPKLGDNIVYFPNGSDTKWHYTKPPVSDIVERAFWHMGVCMDKSFWHWAEEGPIDKNKILRFDDTMTYDSFIERFKMDKEEGRGYDFVEYNGVYMSFFKNNWDGYIWTQPGHIVANAKCKKEIEENINDIVAKLCQKARIGEILGVY